MRRWDVDIECTTKATIIVEADDKAQAEWTVKNRLKNQEDIEKVLKVLSKPTVESFIVSEIRKAAVPEAMFIATPRGV